MGGNHRSDDPAVDRQGWADVRGRLGHTPSSHRLRQPKWVWRILGWLITASIGVEVVEQFTVFGSSGAIVVTASTIVLPLVVAARAEQTA